MTLIKAVIYSSIVAAVLYYYSDLSYWSIAGISFIVFLLNYKPKQRLPVNVGGHAKPGFEKVYETFKELVESGAEQGGMYSVYHKGELVVDVWGGYADEEAKRPWSHETISIYNSSTKAFTAVVVAYLVERGVLDYDAYVSQYWPEFAQNGKESITLEMLMSHQAGVVVIDKKFRIALLKEDPEELGRILAEQKPNWELGNGDFGYHLFTIPLYVDQIIRRVDPGKRSLGQFWRDEIAVPFDIDYHIGLPYEHQHRSARIGTANFSLLYTWTVIVPAYIRVTYLILKDWLFGCGLMMKAAGNPTDWKPSNNNDFKTLEIGAANGYGPTRAAAKLFGILANGGFHNGQKLLSPTLIEKLNTIIVSGYDKFLLMPLSWSVGTGLFQVGTQSTPPNPPERNIFGHGGTGGQMVLADPHYQVAWSYITNFYNNLHGYVMDTRYAALDAATIECIQLLNKKK